MACETFRDEYHPLDSQSKDQSGDLILRPIVAQAGESLSPLGRRVDAEPVHAAGSVVSTDAAMFHLERYCQERGPDRPLKANAGDQQTNCFRRRLLAQVEKAQAWRELGPTAQEYGHVLILHYANEGGEAVVSQARLASHFGTRQRGGVSSRTGTHCRATANRAIRELVQAGIFHKVRRRGVLVSVYRVATAFLTALKAAGHLIRRQLVTRLKPLSVREGVGSSDGLEECQKCGTIVVVQCSAASARSAWNGRCWACNKPPGQRLRERLGRFGLVRRLELWRQQRAYVRSFRVGAA